ncbi:MAG TPA: CAP domain-containing protein [Aquabacterium sp.]|jgi:uncharacterized protein YkwD|nr:CAP domain-containing protein [Aquabacterium sp.]HRH29516.1 CAP domain-containing protein [Aquabacterium sp.]
MSQWLRRGAMVAALALSSPAVMAADATDPLEAQVLTLINAERAALGLDAVLLDLGLDQAAEAHSLDMATNRCFSHDSCNGGLWSTRIKGYYNENTALGEIIAAGYATAESVVAGWMNSPGHKANILDASFKVAGVGLVNGVTGSPYQTYWTVDFGGKTTSQTVVQPVPEPSTWALMLLGLAAVTFATGRRREA